MVQLLVVVKLQIEKLVPLVVSLKDSIVIVVEADLTQAQPLPT